MQRCADCLLLETKRRVASGDKHTLYLRGVRTWDDANIQVADDGYDVYFAESVLGIKDMVRGFSLQDAEQLAKLVSLDLLCEFLY